MKLQDVLDGINLQFGGGYSPDFSNSAIRAANDTLRDMTKKLDSFSHDEFTSLDDTVSVTDNYREMFERGIRYFFSMYGESQESLETVERAYDKAFYMAIVGNYHA